jgi:hypothetical protein
MISPRGIPLGISYKYDTANRPVLSWPTHAPVRCRYLEEHTRLKRGSWKGILFDLPVQEDSLGILPGTGVCKFVVAEWT